MPRTDNRRAHRIALNRAWYCRWDDAAGGSISCSAGESGARVDIVRAIDFLRIGSDFGPRTAATIAATAAQPARWAAGSVGVIGENVAIRPGDRAHGR